MIYFAILLILTGLLILLLSIFMESGKKEKQAVSVFADDDDVMRQPVRRPVEPESVEIPFPSDPVIDTGAQGEEDIYIDFSDSSEVPLKRDLVNEEFTESIPIVMQDEGVAKPAPLPRESAGDKELFSDGVDAVLFDDRSNMIDYDSGGSVIDPDAAGYKNIRRVGSGKLHAEKDGLIFYTGGSLHRFDFHQVFDVWSGSNFVALPLKGSGTVKLFLLAGGEGFPDMVEKYFQEYSKD